MDEKQRGAYDDFRDSVNMTAGELEQWLETDVSRDVGAKPESGGESVGHHSGRRIVELLRTKQGELTDADFAHMRKVAGYVHRHLAQKPDKTRVELQETPWRHSLRNWGHDPLK